MAMTKLLPCCGVALVATSVVAATLRDYPDFRPAAVSDHKILFEANRAWGYADIQGNVLIAPEYSVLSVFQDGTAFGIKTGMPGFLSRNGAFKPRPGLKAMVDAGHKLTYAHQRELFEVQTKEGAFGVADATGRWVLDPIYGWTGVHSGTKSDPLPAAREGQFGFLDVAGRWNATTSMMRVLGSGYTLVGIGMGWQLADLQGKVLSPTVYHELRAAGEGMFEFQTKDERGYVNDRGYLTLQNGTARNMFRARGEYSTFSEGRVFACLDIPAPGSEGAYRATLALFTSGSCTYFDRQGNMLTKTGYRIGSPFQSGVAVACRADIKQQFRYCAWLDRSGKVLVEAAVNGELRQGMADDRVAVLDGRPASRWIFFYRDGSTKTFP